MFRSFFALGLSFCLSGCVYERLSVHTDYVGQETLASYHVGTPDPLLAAPPYGQRLIISWRLPLSYRDRDDLQIRLKIRFRNREDTIVTFPLESRCGSHLYTLLDQDFTQKGGFLAYQAELLAGDEVLETWTHQLWAPLIELVLH